MRTMLSRILFHIGDIYSLIFLRYDFMAQYLYKPYNILMILSCNLDKDHQIWKKVYNDKEL